MLQFRARILCWAAVWLSVFAISIVIAVFPLQLFHPAVCRITQDPPNDDSASKALVRNSIAECMKQIAVEVVSNDTDQRFFAQASAPDCEKEDMFIEKAQRGDQHPCWFRDESEVRLVTSDRQKALEYTSFFSKTLSHAGIAMAAIFGLCFLISITHMFRFDTMRICSRSMMVICAKFQTLLCGRRRPEHVDLTDNEPLRRPHIRQPPSTAHRKRIAALVEESRLSEGEVKELQREGWFCCICLEEESEDAVSGTVSRLQCNHATHTACLQAWLEKGRAVCCLCNASVFSSVDVDSGNSLTDGSNSGFDLGRMASLEVERTDGAPSSPPLSVSTHTYNSPRNMPLISNNLEVEAGTDTLRNYRSV